MVVEKGMLPAQIRDAAIEIVKLHPQGIRLKELIEEILLRYETKLSSYDNPEGKVRNAVWNIDEKFPYLIAKKNTTGRKAMLIPKEVGAPRSKGRVPGSIQEKQGIYEALEERPSNVLHNAWMLLTELETEIEHHKYLAEVVEDVTPRQLGELELDDMNTVIELRGILASIKKCRKIVTDRQDKELRADWERLDVERG